MLTGNHNFTHDVIVIGAGPGGTEAARILSRNGKKVALIESREVGGTCLNRGCIPAKTMLYMAEMYRELKKMADYGVLVNTDAVKIDYNALLARRDQIIERLRKGLTFLINRDKVEFKQAFAELKDPNTVSLSSGETLSAEVIILATGGKSRRFPGFLEEDPRFLVSDNIFELDHLPKSIAIVGAGPVGTEFASYYRAFGVEVHLIERSNQLFHYYDHKLGKALAKELANDGINIHTGTTITNIDTSQKDLIISLENGVRINAEYVLSAIGVEVETQYCSGANLEQDSQTGRIVINNDYQTSYPHIFALGDLIGKSGSAYGAEREAKYIAYKLLGRDLSKVPVNYANMPDVVFTYPQVATCGLSEQELTNANKTFNTKTVQYLVNGKANVKGERSGAIWMYTEPETEKILGVHIVGAEATELIHMVPILLHKGVTVPEYLETVWGHPVLSELLKEVMELG